MTWIATIAYSEATGRLGSLYARIKGPGDKIDNIMLAHSLRPHTMEGHMALYKHVLHNTANRLPSWFLETVGVYVSWINGCAYCVDHHFAGLVRLLKDDSRAGAIRRGLESEDFDGVFSDAQAAALRYAAALTRSPGAVTAAMVGEMRAAGLDDGMILEVNQVAAYFAYANRTVLGLGVTAVGDVLGLAPADSDDQDDWSHR